MSLFEKKVLSYGTVRVDVFDEQLRHISYHISIPNISFQAILPIILAYGLINDLNVIYPLHAIKPQFEKDDIKNEFIEKQPDFHIKLNEIIDVNMNSYVNSINDILKVINDPKSVSFMIPIGVFIEFNYKVGLDDMKYVMMGLKKINEIGIGELNFALAESVSLLV